MYVSDRAVYLQTQKTGCTHIAKLLQKYDGGEIIGKHNPLVEWDKHSDKEIIASIRNPWDWYVSLWAFGCSKRGRLYNHLTATPQSRLKQAMISRSPKALVHATLGLLKKDNLARHRFDVLYSDADNAENFRKWLCLILGEEGKRILPEGYSLTSAKEAIGFFTYRYLQLSTKHNLWQEAKFKLKTQHQVDNFFSENNIVKSVVRNERLEGDLSEILTSLGIQVSEAELKAQGKTNASSHRSFTSYYDQETRNLVFERDKIIATRFDYHFDASE